MLKIPHSKTGRQVSRLLLGILALTIFLCSVSAAQKAEAGKKSSKTDNISVAEFSRIVQSFSEEEGDFASDNYISNENTYLLVTEKLKELGVTGDAYLGVGPEQNFTYIAKIRPQIAFIVDIRRQAIIQHLMYKAIFHMAADRAQFLSLLISKPLKGKDAPGRHASVEELVAYFKEDARAERCSGRGVNANRPCADAASPASQEVFTANLAAIRKMIDKDFEIPLSADDQRKLEHVYSAFHEAGLGITTRWAGGGYGAGWYGAFPQLKDLLLEKDLQGKQANFLATEQDYDFVRDLQRKNRIIPVVGNFAGSKGFSTVANYLRENGYTLAALYTSNVEQYLFGDRVFDAFAENVGKLPLNDHSVIIRSIRGGSLGRRTVLQKVSLFLQDHGQGLYQSYRNLAAAEFMADDETPQPKQ